MSKKPTYEELERRIRELEQAASTGKNTQNALEKSLINDRTIFDTVNDAILIHDLEGGRILDVNQKMSELYGYTREEALQLDIESLSDGISPYSRIEAIEHIQKAIKGEPHIFEWKARKRSGDLFWVEVSLKKTVLDGKDCIIAVIRDINARKRTEERLRRSENLSNAIQRLSKIGAWEWDIAKEKAFWTEEVFRIYDMEPEPLKYDMNHEFVERSLNYFSPEDKPAIWNAFMECVELGISYDLEFSILTAKGRRKWIQARANRVTDKRGVNRVVGYLMDITERKHSEEALRREEKKYRTIIQTALNGFWLVDLHGNILETNAAYCHMSGFSEQEVCSMNVADFDNIEEPHDIAAHIQRTIEQSCDRFETRHRRKDGTLFDVAVSVRYLPDEDGRMVAFLRDISEQKNSQKLLYQNEKKLRALVDNTYQLTGLLDAEGRMLMANKTALDFAGVTEDDVIGRYFWDTKWWSFDPELQALCKDAVQRAMKGGVVRMEIPNMSSGGHTKIVDFSAKSVFDESDDVMYTIVEGRDITENIEIEGALRREEKKYRTILQTAVDGFWLTDVQGQLLEVNDAYCRMSGYSEKELLSMQIPELEGNMGPDDIAAKIDVVLTRGHDRFETKHRRKDGSLYDVEVSVQFLAIEDGRLVNFLRDITERKTIEEELHRHRAHLEELVAERTAALQAVNDELKQFAYITSHDLKAPLRGISRLAQWLADDYATVLDEEGKEMTELLVGRVKRMDNLIDGILKYSRIGRIIGRDEPIDLNLQVTEIIDMLAPPAQITVTCDNDLPVFVGDRVRLLQLFQNLIGNAIKSLDSSEGEVRIGCVNEGRYWKFWVTDTGPGIEECYHERIFQIFQTLKSRDEQESTGIGLAIVKKIVESYHGKIWVESSVGQGSSFFFLLPKSGMSEKIRSDE